MDTLNKAELISFCKENNIKGYSKFNKDELIGFLKKQDINMSNFQTREVVNKETKKETKKDTKKDTKKKESKIDDLEKAVEKITINDNIDYTYYRIDIDSSHITSLKSKLDLKLPDGTTKVNGHGQLTSEGMGISIYIKTPSENKEDIITILRNHYLENENNDIEIEEEVSINEDENEITTTIYKQENVTLKICEDEMFDFFFSN